MALFERFFTGLTDAYGTYDLNTGRARQIKAPVTRQVLLAHLNGSQPYGVYLLKADRTRAVVADFDHQDLNPPIECVRAADHYGIPAYIERSKSKGYHVWVFFSDQGVEAWKARVVMRHVLTEIERPHTEVFPKQDTLGAGLAFGNFIYAPLFGLLVPKGRTVFLDPNDPSKPAPDQWGLLEQVRTVGEATLDEIIAINDLAAGPAESPAAGRSENAPQTLSIPPCAQRMLAEGVRENQRVSCFRLAVDLKRAGLPYDLAVATLMTWAQEPAPCRQTHHYPFRGRGSSGIGLPTRLPGSWVRKSRPSPATATRAVRCSRNTRREMARIQMPEPANGLPPAVKEVRDDVGKQIFPATGLFNQLGRRMIERGPAWCRVSRKLNPSWHRCRRTWPRTIV